MIAGAILVLWIGISLAPEARANDSLGRKALSWGICFEPVQINKDIPAAIVRRNELLIEQEDVDLANAIPWSAAADVRVELSEADQDRMRKGEDVFLTGATVVHGGAVYVHNGPPLEIRRGELLRERFLLLPPAQEGIPKPTRLQLDPDAALVVSLSKPTKVIGTAENPTLPRDTKATLALQPNLPVGVALGDPLLVRPLLLDPNDAFQPHLVAGGPRIQADLSKPGFEFDPAKQSFDACMWRLDRNAPEPARILSLEPAVRGFAELTLQPPAGIFPFDHWARTQSAVAVASYDGTYSGVGHLWIVSPILAFAIAIVVTICIVLLVIITQKRRLFLDAGGQPNPSPGQTFVWTVIIIWGLIYVFMRTSDLLPITMSVIALLGISGGSSVLANFISKHARRAAFKQPSLSQLVMDDEGRIEIARLQMIAFTAIIATWVVYRIAVDTAFPVLSPELLLLMTASHGIYVAGEQVRYAS